MKKILINFDDMHVFDFSNLNLQEKDNNNCFGCDSCDSCDCDSCDSGW